MSDYMNTQHINSEGNHWCSKCQNYSMKITFIFFDLRYHLQAKLKCSECKDVTYLKYTLGVLGTDKTRPSKEYKRFKRY